jgi:CBS domain-containing protein
METRVADILRRKGSQAVSCKRTTTVFEAIATMVDHNVGAILVTDHEGLCGIFTERDYLRRIILQGRTSKTTPIEDVMTSNVLRAAPDDTLRECMATMTRQRCRHLPVEENGELAGVISLGDCVKELLGEAEARVNDLTGYITGQYPV